MSLTPKKSILGRIRVNNILAVLLVATYAVMWSFAIYSAITGNLADAVVSLLGSSAMTVLVTLVVQFYFRKPQTELTPS